MEVSAPQGGATQTAKRQLSFSGRLRRFTSSSTVQSGGIIAIAVGTGTTDTSTGHQNSAKLAQLVNHGGHRGNMSE